MAQTLAEYTRSVTDRLYWEGAATDLSPAEAVKVEAGLAYGVGAGDCAFQIIADRADSSDV